MNIKAQLNTGGIVLLAITLIIGAVFAIEIATQQSVMTTTRTVVNGTFDASANGTFVPNSGAQAITGFTATNGTNVGIVIGAGNYTITNHQNVDDSYVATILVDVPTATADEFAHTWYVSYTYEPQGYNEDTAARTIVGLPLLFFILALMAAALIGLRSWITSK